MISSAPFFAKIASEVDASLRAKEAEMRQVIATERAKYPGGRFTGSPPSVPVQLLKLGSERDAIVAAGIQRLQQQLGPRRLPPPGPICAEPFLEVCENTRKDFVKTIYAK
jgi:hypothetical protein